MGITYKYLPERYLIYVRLEGYVDQKDIFRYFAKFERDTTLVAGCNELIDFSALTDLDLTYEEMRTVRLREEGYYKSAPAPVLCVIHAPRDTTFGMARMYQQMVAATEDHIVQIARTEAETLQMLSQPEARFSELLGTVDSPA
ncbi:hypothetical protein QO034_04875 [Sedimentitalea sp. JM2-8]|uniref:Uncharacterized protein n=1 Tax=Sedimentitalea xiamensis TaxID=3050037 RepID=A0ABT7FBG9_9RHOB|nr:hypothetical protein [Sedimentitalea xiamensis]MDK3072439.1 hypothetical protein [Sedimentitalea xiamensis]